MKRRPLSLWVSMLSAGDTPAQAEQGYYPFAVGYLTSMLSYEDTQLEATCLSACITTLNRRIA